MTDRDPAARRPRPGSATPGERGPSSPGAPTPTGRRSSARSSVPSSAASGAARSGTPSGAPAGTSLRDRWWWSPTLSIVIGLVVIGYQLDPLRGSNPLWGNWVVAALGLVVAVHGVVRLLRAHRER